MRKSWLRRVALSLLAAELLYVAAFEVAARSGRLERWINRRPEKVAISFAAAHSWFPFWGTVRGLEVRGQAPKVRWRVQAEEARAWLAPLPLLARRLRFSSAEARGVVTQLRLERAEEQLTPELEAMLPPIPPLAPPPAMPRPVRPKWSFELPSVDAREVHELWIDVARLAGDLSARGGLATSRGVEVEIFPSEIKLADGRLRVGRLEVASSISGHAELAIARWPFKEKPGLGALPFLSAKLDGRGTATVGAFVREQILPSFLRFEHQPAPFAARLEVRHGVLQPGTEIELESTPCELGIYDFAVTGKASARLAVAADAAGPQGEAELRFADFEMRQASDPRAEVVGSGLLAVARTRDLMLHSPPYTATAHVDFGKARLADLAVYDRLIPESLPLVLEGGSGSFEGSVDARLPELAASGRFRVRVHEASVRYGELGLRGSVAVDLPVVTDNLATRRFDVAGLRIDLTDFQIPQARVAGRASEAGWWGAIEVPRAQLLLPPGPAADASFVVRLRDSVPIVGLFASRRDLPNWVERVLSVRDVRAEGRVGWAPGSFMLEDFATRFRRASIHAKARFDADHRAGVMKIEWWRLALGARFDDAKRKLKLTKVREWYEAQDLGGLPRGEDVLAPPAAARGAEGPPTLDREGTTPPRLAGTAWRLEAVVPPNPALTGLRAELSFDQTGACLDDLCGRASTDWSAPSASELHLSPFAPAPVTCGEPLATESRRLRALVSSSSLLSLTAEELLLTTGEAPDATQLFFAAAKP